MSESIKQHVDTSSAEFKHGVEAGLNSTEDTKNWQAGIELGQELKDEGGNKEPISDVLSKEPSTPLLLKIVQEAMRETPKVRRMKRKNKFFSRRISRIWSLSTASIIECVSLESFPPPFQLVQLVKPFVQTEILPASVA